MAEEVASATAVEIARMVAGGSISAREVALTFLDRIEKVNSSTNAFLHVNQDWSLSCADLIDQKIARGENPGPLAGVPIAIKDALCIEGAPTTCGSRILEDYRPPYTATVVRRVLEAGAVPIGKTNMDEFAMGSSNESSGFRKCFNPWDLSRAPGGSSGGSAVAVAAGMAPVALGSDTGGSIRQPAAFCGVTGMKPTWGRVSRYGLGAFASSLDQVGPLSRTVEDSALLLSVIAGHDERDSTSLPDPVDDYRSALGSIKGLRVGVPAEYFGEGLDGEVAAAVRAAIATLEEMGASLVEVSLPHLPYAVAAYCIVSMAESSSNLARYDGVHYGARKGGTRGIDELYAGTRAQLLGREVKRRIMLGTFVLSSGYYDAYYLKGLKARRLIRRDFEEAFEKVDVIAGPTTPTAAFRIGEKINDPLAMYLSDIFTISAPLAGIPAISVPCGFTSERLPVGFQIMGRLLDEKTVLSAAAAFQGATDFHEAACPL